MSKLLEAPVFLPRRCFPDLSLRWMIVLTDVKWTAASNNIPLSFHPAIHEGDPRRPDASSS